jgi:hypothetical protein
MFGLSRHPAPRPPLGQPSGIVMPSTQAQRPRVSRNRAVGTIARPGCSRMSEKSIIGPPPPTLSPLDRARRRRCGDTTKPVGQHGEIFAFLLLFSFFSVDPYLRSVLSFTRIYHVVAIRDLACRGATAPKSKYLRLKTQTPAERAAQNTQGLVARQSASKLGGRAPGSWATRSTWWSEYVACWTRLLRLLPAERLWLPAPCGAKRKKKTLERV